MPRPAPRALVRLPETGDLRAAAAAAARALGLTGPRADFRLRARDPRQDMQYGESLLLVDDPAPHRRARLVFSRARRAWPSCAGAWLAAAAAETVLARFPAALPLYARAARLAPDSAWIPAWRGVARALDERRRRAERLKSALSDFDLALERGADPAFVAPWRAELRHDLDDRAGALEDLARIPPGDPSALWARVERGEILCECGRADEALAEFDRLASEHPKASWAWALRGRTLATTGRPARGLPDLDRAVRLAPRAAAPRAWRSETLRALGRYGEALKDLDRATRLDPGYTLGWVWRGRLKLLLGRPAEALKDLDRAVRQDPRYRLGLAWRGEALFKLGRTREAARDFARVAPLDPRRSWTPVAAEGTRADAAARERAYWADLRGRVASRPDDRWARRLLAEALSRGAGEARAA
ncbi:MAG: tetratricopeptide repeat protein [Elusimicrobia bacterium]|nr:tetratricopeptide repeat protein [Elusimicrobiota bacterium]